MDYVSESESIANLLSLSSSQSSSSSSKSSALSHTKSNIIQPQNFAATNQVAMKFDKEGEILQTNVTPDLKGKNIIDLCHNDDKDKMKLHIHTVLNPKQTNLMSTSSHVPPNYSCLESFRIHLNPQLPFVRVKADSRFFYNQTPGECDYIMCVLTVIDGPLDSVENSNSTSSPIDSFMPSSIESNLYAKQNSNYLSSSSSSSNVGGPLMTSVLNASSPRATQQFTNTMENPVFNDYELDFDMDQVHFEPSRPNSRASSSSNMFHSANIPSNIEQDSSNVCGFNFNVFPNNYGGGGGGGPEFSDSRDQLNNNSKFSNKNLLDNHNSEKLRNLLTTKKSTTEEQEQQNRILKVSFFFYSDQVVVLVGFHGEGFYLIWFSLTF